MHIQLLVLGAIATIVFLVLRIKKGGLPAAAAKACASAFFVFTGLASAIDAMPSYNQLMVGFMDFNPWCFILVGGLICSLIGDLWLDLKYVYLENSNEFTALGMAFFLGAQLLYFASAFNCFVWGNNMAYIYASVVVAAIFALITVFGERRILKVHFGKFKPIAACYTAALGFTTTFSICCAISTGFSTSALLMMIGEILLLISDAILCGTYFGVGKNTKKYVISNHVIYYIAQYALALSIFYI